MRLFKNCGIIEWFCLMEVKGYQPKKQTNDLLHNQVNFQKMNFFLLIIHLLEYLRFEQLRIK
jgi:hypothetical protein